MELNKITKTNILVCAVSHNEDVIIPDGIMLLNQVIIYILQGHIEIYQDFV